MPNLQHTSELHDYTELVIELWTAYMLCGFNLSNIGVGDSRDGIDIIAREALHLLEIAEEAESRGYWWDGGWIEAVQDYAHFTVATFKYGPAHEAVVFDITKYMEPKEPPDGKN